MLGGITTNGNDVHSFSAEGEVIPQVKKRND